jgi:uncharacterized membrane protein
MPGQPSIRAWRPSGAPRIVADVTKNRLEAFSDGVFAIAITLLVIELHTPEVGEGGSLAAALWAQWPSYVAYLVSFLTIGVIWLNHHRVFTQVALVDGPLLVLNLVVLLWTALIPFPTAVVARYLGQGGEHAETAVAFYLALGLSFVWPPAALALHAAMALYYAFDQASVPATPAPGQGRPSRRPA